MGGTAQADKQLGLGTGPSEGSIEILHRTFVTKRTQPHENRTVEKTEKGGVKISRGSGNSREKTSLGEWRKGKRPKR